MAKSKKSKLDLNSIPIESLVRQFKKAPAGKRITKTMILEDVKAGFKLNSDGSVNISKYAIWLLRQHGYGEDS